MTALALIFYRNCYAQSLSSTELIERAKEYNNQVVEYEGEVVGDVMARGHFAWVNVNDGENAIGVWGGKDLIGEVAKVKGNYNYKGDIIRVKGVFHRACPTHGGDLDIHIGEVEKIKDGSLLVHPVSALKIKIAIGLSLAALGLAVWAFIKAKRKG